MKKILKLAFVDFAVNWGAWPSPLQFFVDVLGEEYTLDIVQSDWRCYQIETPLEPDLVIYSHPGIKHLDYKCPKIFFSGEPCELNFDNYDYAMTYHFSGDPRHYRLPLYALYGDVDRLIELHVYDPAWAQREFCCVLFGRSYPHEQTPREQFFRELCKYKHVHSAGRYLNNTGFVVPSEKKAEYVKNFKFTLSFESCAVDGFTSEKIFEPLLMNTVPIYWGNPLIGLDFNPSGFINCTGLSTEEAIRFIQHIDTHDDVYREMILAPRYASPYVDKKNILKFFREVLRDT